MVILEDWSKWMKKDSHRLGYPNRTSYLSSGGESTIDVFDEMLNEADDNNVKIINACIDSLPIDQKKAIYYRWLKGNKPIFYERNFYQYVGYQFSKLSPKNKIVTSKFKNGLKFKVGARTMDRTVVKEVFMEEIYDKHRIKVEKGDTVLDIGAHIGVFGVYAAANQKQE